jgi:hypothetical protein
MRPEIFASPAGLALESAEACMTHQRPRLRAQFLINKHLATASPEGTPVSYPCGCPREAPAPCMIPLTMQDTFLRQAGRLLSRWPWRAFESISRAPGPGLGRQTSTSGFLKHHNDTRVTEGGGEQRLECTKGAGNPRDSQKAARSLPEANSGHRCRVMPSQSAAWILRSSHMRYPPTSDWNCGAGHNVSQFCSWPIYP